MTKASNSSGRLLFAGGTAIVLLGLAFAAFGVTVDHGFVNYDDPSAIIENPVIEGPGDGRWRQLLTERREDVYLPVWFASYWIDHALFGRDPGGFHLVNLILHALSALLLGLVLRMNRVDPWLACAAAALFVVHPAATESVAWATERKGLLAIALALGALLLGTSFCERGGPGRLVGAGLLFVLALFAKATVFVLPLLFIVLRGLAAAEPAKGESGAEGGSRRRIATGLFALLALMGVAIHLLIAMDAGTANLEASEGLFDRALGMLGVLGRYGAHLVLPLELAVHYPNPFGQGFGLDQGHGLVVLGLLAGAAWSFRRAPGPIAGGLLWVGIALIPFNNLMPRFDIAMADRYLYGAIPGAALALGGLVFRMCSRFGRGVVVALIAALVLLGIFGSRAQVPAWADSTSLWRDAISAAPEEMLPRLQLGVALEQEATTLPPLEARRRLEEALGRYEEARDRAASDRERAQAQVKRAPALVRLARPVEALAAFAEIEEARASGRIDLPAADRDALRISEAAALIASDRREEARERLQAVASTTALQIEAQNQLAVLATLDANASLEAAETEEAQAAARREYEAALDQYRLLAERWPRHEKSRCEYLRALSRADWLPNHGIEIARLSRLLVDDFPKSAEAHLLRARCYLNADQALAEADLKIAARLDPSRIEASLLLADLVRSQGRNKEAIAVLIIARRSNPDSPALAQAMADHYLAFAYHHRNTQALDLALAATAQTLELDPQRREAMELRGELYAERAASKVGTVPERAQDFERARDTFEQILAEDPANERALKGLAQLYRREGLARVYAASRPGEDEAKTQARIEAGFDAFMKAVRLLPEDPDNAGPKRMMQTHAQDCARRAAERLELGRDEEALRLANRAVAFAPEVPDYRARLANVRRRAQGEDKAIEAWREALAIDPNHLESLYELGSLMIERREWSEAREHLLRFAKVAKVSEFRGLLGRQIVAAEELAKSAAAQLEKRDDDESDGDE
jgi:protein O-mannosyl-transferase